MNFRHPIPLSPLLLPFLPYWCFLSNKSPFYFHFFFVWVELTELNWNCLLKHERRLLTKGQLTHSYTTEENDTPFHSNHYLPLVPQKRASWIPLILCIFEQISKLCWVPECTGYVCLFVDPPPTLCLSYSFLPLFHDVPWVSEGMKWISHLRLCLLLVFGLLWVSAMLIKLVDIESTICRWVWQTCFGHLSLVLSRHI